MQHLKLSYLDAQGSIFDDTGAVGTLSTRSIALECREGKRFHENKEIYLAYSVQVPGAWLCIFEKFDLFCSRCPKTKDLDTFMFLGRGNIAPKFPH